jgi:hypothetical protein
VDNTFRRKRKDEDEGNMPIDRKPDDTPENKKPGEG